MNHFDELYLNCSCFAETLHVARDRETGEVYLALYQPRGTGKMPWGWRLRHIWRILTKGYPFEDDIILTPNDATQFGVWLLKQEGRES